MRLGPVYPTITSAGKGPTQNISFDFIPHVLLTLFLCSGEGTRDHRRDSKTSGAYREAGATAGVSEQRDWTAAETADRSHQVEDETGKREYVHHKY